MPKVALTPAQELRRWYGNMYQLIGRHINKHDPEAEYGTVGELAHEIGASRQSLSKYFNGHTMPSLRMFARMCVACRLDPADIGRLVLQLGGIR